MTRSEVEAALAEIIDAESAIRIPWFPGSQMAPIAFRRWSSFGRRHWTKIVGVEDKVLDLAKGLQAAFEPDVARTPLSEYIHLARKLVEVFDQAEIS